MNRTVVEAPKIRPGTLAELHRCADFWIAMFEEIGNYTESDFTPDWRERFQMYFERRISGGEARFSVAVEHGKILGTAGAMIADGYPFAIHGIKRGYIFGVCVDPAHRGRGIATRLTQDAVAYLREAGCTRVRLHASQFGLPIYERLGFRPTNEMEI